MEETSVEDIANNVTTQLLRGAKTKDETLSMEAKPTHEDSDSVEIIVVVDDSVAKPAAQAQVQSLLQKQERSLGVFLDKVFRVEGAGRIQDSEDHDADIGEDGPKTDLG